MPQILLPALFSAGSEALIAGTMAGFWTTFAVDAALGAALYAMSPKPQSPQTGPQTLTVKSSNEPWKFIYGEARVGGVLTFIESTSNNQYLHLVVTFAAHEVQDFTTIYFDDQALVLSGNDVTTPTKYAGKVKVYPVKVGSVANIPPSLISETSWTTAYVEEGHAYIYFRLEYNRDAFSGGMPNISVVIKGKKVYDPRTSATAWSDNPALCIRDYLMTPDHLGGLGIAATEMDDVVITAAANVCDETVTLAAGGTQKRYTMNGVVDTGVKPLNSIKAMLTSMAGSLYDSNGKWKLRAGAYVTPTVTLDETDLAGPMTTDTAISAGMNFNAIKGQFVGPESDYQPTDYAPITSSTFEAEDGGFRKFKGDFNLPYTNTSEMAQRIAKLVLYQNRQVITIRASYKLSAFKFDVGDTVMINDVRKGFSNKPFVVTQWAFNFSEAAVIIDVVLRETNPQVYAWNAEEKAFSQDNTTLPDPTFVPDIGISITASVMISNQNVVNKIAVTATASDPYAVARVVVEFKKSSSQDWAAFGMGQLGVFEKTNLEETSYDFRARAENVLGVTGEWSYITGYLLDVLSIPPQDVTGFDIAIVGTAAHFTWDASVDPDLSHYIIRYSPLVVGATWAGSSIRVARVSRPATSVTAPAEVGSYLIKAVNKLGNESVNAAKITTTVASIEDLNAVDTVTENPAFDTALLKWDAYSGLMDSWSASTMDNNFGFAGPLTVMPSGLRITDVSAPSSQVYTFSTQVDLGAKYTSRVTKHVQFSRWDINSPTWDTYPQAIDLWAGIDLIGSTIDVGDTNVVIDISSSDDMVSWSPWRVLNVGDFSARGLKFRATLSSNSPGASPLVSLLSVTIDMPDRIYAQSDITSGYGPKTVLFIPAFKGLSGLGISAQGMQTGDFYDMTAKTPVGFTIEFKDASGASINRTFDFVAKGYGAIS